MGTISVSLVVTVKNEAVSLPELLTSIEAQTRLPDEVVFVDGGSTDGTFELLQEWGEHQRYPVRILQEPGCNIARGRNLGIAVASGTVIAVTDAGVRLEPQWLACLVRPFEQANPPEVVAGVFRGQASGTFHTAMAATVLPEPEELDPCRFWPSSRSIAFTKGAWEAVGGYPEWASFCEDLLFDMALAAAGKAFAFAPKALVHFPPRRTLYAFFRQYRNYAMGDGQTGLYPSRHLARYATYLGLVPLLLLASVRFSPFWLLGYAAGGALYLRRPFLRLARRTQGFPFAARLAAFLWLPVIRICGDVAKMVGYPAGLPRGLLLRNLNRRYRAGRLRRICH